jgi:hypothetical protein
MTCREQSVHAELNDQGPFLRDDYIQETLVALPCCLQTAGTAVPKGVELRWTMR